MCPLLYIVGSNKMAKKKIASTVENILNPFLEKEGYMLYHVEFVKEGQNWFLRVYIDNEEGRIGTNDCEKVSGYLSEKLDKTDPIEQNYYLEVSSPGLDRELFTEEHFSRYIGEDVDVHLYSQIDGNKIITGILKSFTGEDVTLTVSGTDKTILKSNIAKVSLTVKI